MFADNKRNPILAAKACCQKSQRQCHMQVNHIRTTIASHNFVKCPYIGFIQLPFRHAVANFNRMKNNIAIMRYEGYVHMPFGMMKHYGSSVGGSGGNMFQYKIAVKGIVNLWKPRRNV